MEWLFVGGFGLLWIGGTALWIFARSSTASASLMTRMYRSGTKLIWIIEIALTQVIGAIIYLVIGRPGAGTRPPAVGVPPPRQPPTI
jgi:hypothetical protein